MIVIIKRLRYSQQELLLPRGRVHQSLLNRDYETARAIIVEEAEKLGKEGWIKYDEICGVHLYRRLKL